MEPANPVFPEKWPLHGVCVCVYVLIAYTVFACFSVLGSGMLFAVQSVAGDSDVGFLAGKQLSMADMIFFPSLALYVRFGLELEPKFPHLARYYKKMLQLPSVKKTWPPHWVGTEAPKKLFVPA